MFNLTFRVGSKNTFTNFKLINIKIILKNNKIGDNLGKIPYTPLYQAILRGAFMKNNKILVLFVLFLSFCVGNEFVIKLASYTNKDNLVKQVSLLDSEIRDNVYILKEKNLYKLFSKPSPSKNHAMLKLPLYRKVFQDAYIMVATEQNKQTYNNKVTPLPLEESNSTFNHSLTNRPYIKKHNEIMIPIRTTRNIISLENILPGNTFYICPNKINTSLEKLLIEVKFNTDSVTYTSIIGNIPSLEMNYTIKNGRLYFPKGDMITPHQYSQIDKVLFEYNIISKWSRGRKMNQMRYYRKQEDAKSYLDSLIF